MDKKNILIATQSLGIGGCETYILTQCKTLIKNGYNIVIIAKDGALRNEFEKLGTKFYDLDLFRIDEDTINEISQIIKKENISQVHIHPFYPFYNVVAACILTKIPYVLYFHGVIDIENMLEAIIGKGINKLFLDNVVFKYASKYIYVSEECKTYIEDKFNLEKSRGMLLPNCICLSNLKFEERKVNEILNFVILSRIDVDKLDSIKQGIEFYKKYFLKYLEKYGTSNKLRLDICGEGNALESLKQYITNVSDIDYNINCIGACKEEVFETINKYDVVLGMGRCMLEAIAVKKIPILISYNEYIGLINASITKMENLSYSNFSGRGVEPKNMQQDIDFIFDLNVEGIDKVITQNFKYLQEHNNLDNISENIRFLIENNSGLCSFDDCDINSYIELITEYNSLRTDINRVYGLYESLKKDYDIIMEQHQKDIDEVISLKEELFKNKKSHKLCDIFKK